jgi:SAM-dependent methyltransferase
VIEHAHDTPRGAAAPTDTASAGYTDRLDRLTGRTWKQRLDVQRPYRWNVRRLNLGRVLDVGCGIGRNLAHLDGNAVGIDHNPTSVAKARERGLTAFTPEEFRSSRYNRSGAFDSLLLAHVVDFAELEKLSREVGLAVERSFSFPFPARPAGCSATTSSS